MVPVTVILRVLEPGDVPEFFPVIGVDHRREVEVRIGRPEADEGVAFGGHEHLVDLAGDVGVFPGVVLAGGGGRGGGCLSSPPAGGGGWSARSREDQRGVGHRRRLLVEIPNGQSLCEAGILGMAP